MRAIWKFPLKTTDTQSVSMPSEAQILCVQTQHDEPMIWALVNPDAPLVNRQILTYGTGHPVASDRAEYIGTYQLHGGGLVFHVFDCTEDICKPLAQGSVREVKA